MDCRIFDRSQETHHDNVLPLNSYTSCNGQFYLTGDWLCTCDLMIVSVGEAEDGGRYEGSDSESDAD